MAKRTRKRKRTGVARKSAAPRRRRSTLAASGGRRRRRRRLGAGDKMFKMFSNPLMGGAASAVAGRLGKNMIAKVAKDSQMIGILAIGGGAFLLQKKAPFISAGLAGSATNSLLDQLIAKQPADSFIRKMLGDDAHFVNDNLLNEPIILNADGDQILPYQLKDMLLNEMSNWNGQVHRIGNSMNTMDDED